MEVHVKVWLTKKTKRIRAQITEKPEFFQKEAPYEVTIGGKEWFKGKGQQHKAIIKRKVELMQARINTLIKDLD